MNITVGLNVNTVTNQCHIISKVKENSKLYMLNVDVQEQIN